MDWKQLLIGLVVSGFGLVAIGCGKSAAAPTTSKSENAAPLIVKSDSNVQSSPTVAEVAPPPTPVSVNNPSPSNGRPATSEKIPVPKVGSGANDFYFFTKIRGRFASENDLRDAEIAVDVKDGVVNLTGSVNNPAQRDKAQRIAKDVEGIQTVKNQLVIRIIKQKGSDTNDHAIQPMK